MTAAVAEIGATSFSRRLECAECGVRVEDRAAMSCV